MSEELLASLIKEWRDCIRDKYAIITQLTALENRLNTPTDPVSYDEAIVLQELRNDWKRESDELVDEERKVSNDIGNILTAIGETVPDNIPIIITVDEITWVVQSFSEGSVEVRARES